ncbi:MAG: hypothetical protein ACOYJQ_06110 [Pseudochelatococcus sp.]|uniref:hypothetical protein n=1 Tax=Pseudochelatococcus sp. TaxID=2020869 RepID=UPI003D8DF556
MPRGQEQVAVVVWPWAGPARAVEVVAAAGGTLVAGARWPFILIARSPDSAFIDRLYASGAAVVFNPGILAGCLSTDF